MDATSLLLMDCDRGCSWILFGFGFDDCSLPSALLTLEKTLPEDTSPYLPVDGGYRGDSDQFSRNEEQPSLDFSSLNWTRTDQIRL
jgi:hypothetical protein